MIEKPLIAILTNHDDDIYCFRLELIQALLNEGYRLLISCPDGPKLTLMAQRYGLIKGKDYLYDDPPIDRRGTSVIQDGMLFVHYFRLMRKYHPSTILTYTPKPNVYAAFSAHLCGIPVINNVTGFGSVLNLKGIMYHLIMALFRSTYRKSSCVMFQNKSNMQYALEHGFIKGEYKLIPGSGVALHRFPVQDYPEGGNGITGPTVVFNYIGRVLKEKGVDDYLEAARRIKAQYPRTEFNLIGFIEPTEAHYRDKLDELGKQGIVIYRGEQNDILPWIKRSHMVIHPSVYGEGMSNVLLENASCGRPIITTDNPGCQEAVDDRISGFIYHGGNIALLEEIIRLFLGMPEEGRREMGLKGREKVEREFDRNIVIETYLQTIQQLCR